MKTSIEVKFESFTTESNWVNGECDGYHFEAKLYDEPSIFGIQKGRVSKLAIFRPSPDNSPFPVELFSKQWQYHYAYSSIFWGLGTVLIRIICIHSATLHLKASKPI